MLDSLDRLVDWIEGLAGAMVLAITGIVFYEIFVRYLFDAPTLWAQDVSVYLLLWVAFLGLAPAEKSGQHIRIDLVYTRLPAVVRGWLEIAMHLAVAGFALVAAWSGTAIVIQSLRLGRKSMSLFTVPMWIPQLALPVGFLLLAVVCLARAWTSLRRADVR